MRQHSASFANFICRFGDEKVLLDYAEEIVIPAFTRDTYVRSYGKRTHYHFYNVELINLDEEQEVPVLGLAGRFIKDTELTRHQIFDQKKGLIQDEQKMRSAPSVFFILILNNHRLIYFSETPYAPDMNSFKTTAEKFLRRRHKEYIEELYEKLSEGSARITKKEIYKTHPLPTLEVIPLTGKDDIAHFMRRYKILKRINFRLVRPNDDIDAGEILGQVREFGRELNADRTELITANSDGLDVNESIEAVTAATQSGNQDVKLSGIDQEGNKLSGNNENFQISSPVENIPTTKHGLIDRLYSLYDNLLSSGAIGASLTDRARDRIRQLVSLL